MSNDLPTQTARDAIAAEAARRVIECAADPAARAAAMDWAATSPHHAVALARAEAAWDAAARVRAVPRGPDMSSADAPTRPPPNLRLMVLLGMLAASIVGGIAITATLATRPTRCTTAIAHPFALAARVPAGRMAGAHQAKPSGHRA